MTRTYYKNITVRLAVEADSRAEADRELKFLRREVRNALPVGAKLADEQED